MMAGSASRRPCPQGLSDIFSWKNTFKAQGCQWLDPAGIVQQVQTLDPDEAAAAAAAFLAVEASLGADGGDAGQLICELLGSSSDIFGGQTPQAWLQKLGMTEADLLERRHTRDFLNWLKAYTCDARMAKDKLCQKIAWLLRLHDLQQAQHSSITSAAACAHLQLPKGLAAVPFTLTAPGSSEATVQVVGIYTAEQVQACEAGGRQRGELLHMAVLPPYGCLMWDNASGLPVPMYGMQLCSSTCALVGTLARSKEAVARSLVLALLSKHGQGHMAPALAAVLNAMAGLPAGSQPFSCRSQLMELDSEGYLALGPLKGGALGGRPAAGVLLLGKDTQVQLRGLDGDCVEENRVPETFRPHYLSGVISGRIEAGSSMGKATAALLMGKLKYSLVMPPGGLPLAEKMQLAAAKARRQPE